MTKAQAISDIRQAIAEGGGAENPRALRKVRESCFFLRTVCSSGRDKISEIEGWADKFYSTIKWKAYPGEHPAIGTWVLLACSALESQTEGED